MADDPTLPEELENKHSNSPIAADTTVIEAPESIVGLWDIAFIHAFVSTFSTLQDPALHPCPTFQPEQLEQDLMFTARSDLVDQLLCSFTSNALNRKKPYDSSTIRRGLFELMSAKVKASEFLFNFNPMAGNIDFDQLEPIVKVEILRSLVEWQLEDCNAIRGLIEKHSRGNRYQEDNPVDILPVGMDSQKRIYWQFGDSARLWREKKGAKTHQRAQWEIATRTLDELREFAESIADTKSRTEKQLYLQLINQTIPDIEFGIAQREKVDKKQRAVEKLLEIQLTNDPMSLRPRNRKPVQYRFDDIYDYEDEDDEYEEDEEAVSVKTGTRSSRRIAQRETSPLSRTPQGTRASSRLRGVNNEIFDEPASQSSPSIMDETDDSNHMDVDSNIDTDFRNANIGNYIYGE